MNIPQCLATACIATLAFIASTIGGATEPQVNQWDEFRNGGSSTVEGELPVHWNSQTIAWQHELVGYGQSTPIIYNDRVFVTSVEGPMKDECVVSCYELKSGRQLWIYRAAASVKAASNYMASRAAPTPVVDSRAVYAFFESGDCFAVDHAGGPVWHRTLGLDYGKFENNHGLGASPTQTGSTVIINVEHKGPSYLIALDKATGATTWKVNRHSSSSWSSPILVNAQEQWQVIVSSGGTVDSYDALTGKSLWSIGGLDGNSVPSPTAADNLLYVGARVPEFGSDGEAAKSNLCIDLRDWNGTSAHPPVAWRASKAISDYASPVVCGECVHYLNKVGVLYCLSKSTGAPHYMERLGTQCWATPIVADDHVFFFGKDGRTQIIRSGPTFDLIGSNLLWDSQNVPKPETYSENNDAPRGHDENGSGGGREPGRAGGQGGSMLAALMKADVDADGVLSAPEIPAEFAAMLPRIDANKDGSLDQAELKAMADSFASRRSESAQSARDPIVYGAAAVKGAIVIRTGTRLYCVQ